MLMICVFPHMYYTLQEMLKLPGAIIISHKLQEEANADSNENFFFQKNTHPLHIKSKQIGHLLAGPVENNTSKSFLAMNRFNQNYLMMILQLIKKFWSCMNVGYLFNKIYNLVRGLHKRCCCLI